MATVKKRPASTRSSRRAAEKEKFQFPLTKTNFLILGFGVLVLIAGYILMAIPDHPDDFLTRTLAPVLLVFSFLVIIPFGLMYKEKKQDNDL